MSGPILVERAQVDGPNGFLKTTVYDPNTGRIVPTPGDAIIVSEEVYKSGQIDPNKPNAVPRVIQDKNGTQIVYVDATTGQQIVDLSKYNVLDSQTSNIEQLGLVKRTEPKVQEAINSGKQEDIKSYGGNRGLGDTGTSPKEDASNNFGYMSKPGLLSAAKFAPGPLGLIGTAANIGMDMANNGSVKKAQSYLGFDKDESLGGMLGNNQGYVGDLSYNGQTTAVGLDAQDKLGRTTLTPNEARMRQQLSGAVQATPEQTKANVDSFKTANPGLLGRMAKSFGITKDDPADNPTPRAINTDNTPAQMKTSYDSQVRTDSAAVSTPQAGVAGRSMGYTAAQAKQRTSTFSPDDRDAMAKTLAGEIDFSKTDLSTPAGQQEAFGVLSSMENRSKKYGSVAKAAYAPNQYSTWNTPSTTKTALGNYAKNKSMIDSVVDRYTRDPDANLGFTSYYNDSIADPAWGASMDRTTKIGPHKFGNLAEYGTNPYTAADDMSRFAPMQAVENDRQLRASTVSTPSASLNYGAINAYRSPVDYSGPKGVVGVAQDTNPSYDLSKSTYGLNTNAQTAYRSLDSYYSGPKGVVGPSVSSKASIGNTTTGEDRSTRSSVANKGTSTSKGFASAVGEDRSTRSSVANKSSAFSGSSSKGSVSNSASKSSGGFAGSKASGSVSNKSDSKSKGAQSRSDGWN